MAKKSKARFICDRSGFEYPISEAVMEDGLMIHRSEADGKWSKLKHPLNNLGRYLRGKSGDPFPIKNARPDRNWVVPTRHSGAAFVTATASASGSGLMNYVGNSSIVATATSTLISTPLTGAATITANATAEMTIIDWNSSDWDNSDWEV